MKYNKEFYEKVFSSKRMERYFKLHSDENKALIHSCCNIELAESFYPSLSVFEVALRNALSRELQNMTGREDWYEVFTSIKDLEELYSYIVQAKKQISNRSEVTSPSKVIAELTLGFWVSLLNSEYEKVLWKSLRKAFPCIPKNERKRKNISTPLNNIRRFRNRIFHNESICWNMDKITSIHSSLILVMGWINADLPNWLKEIDRFESVKSKVLKCI